MKIKKGDNVIVRAGKDRGKEGKVLRVWPAINRLTIEQVNLRRRRIRARKANEKGQTVEIAFPLDASKVMIKCGRCNRGVRIGRQVEGKKVVRLCRRCGSAL